jgi:DNA-binding YbaB/EbfC family protein
MNMFDMMGKIGQLKKTMDEIKERLDNITVAGEAGEGNVKITMTANKKVTSVSINDRMMDNSRREELEELLELAFNRASDQAQNVSETEMKAAGKGILPNIPGLF